MEKKDERAKKIFWIAVLVIIIIILILFHFNRIGEIENDKFIPTGYVDVFDIEFGIGTGNIIKNPENDKNPSDKKDETVENNKDESTDDSNNNEDIELPEEKPNDKPDDNSGENIEKPEQPDEPENPETPETPEIPEEPEQPEQPENPEDKYGIIFKSDENGGYICLKTLEIFKNAAYEYTNKIAPGVSNTYNFIVHNSTDARLNYKIEMYEETEYKVNLKYRLRRNNEYVVGDDSTWVAAEEVKTELSKIESDGSDNYSLDWKWFHDDTNDTIAGRNMTSEYKIYMRVYMELAGEQ